MEITSRAKMATGVNIREYVHMYEYIVHKLPFVPKHKDANDGVVCRARVVPNKKKNLVGCLVWLIGGLIGAFCCKGLAGLKRLTAVVILAQVLLAQV